MFCKYSAHPSWFGGHEGVENPINDDEKRWLRCPKLSSIVFTPNIILNAHKFWICNESYIFHGRHEGTMGLTTSNGFRSTRARVYGPGDVRPKSGNSDSPCRALPCIWSSLVNMVITRIDRSTSQLTSTRSIWVMTAQRWPRGRISRTRGLPF